MRNEKRTNEYLFEFSYRFCNLIKRFMIKSNTTHDYFMSHTLMTITII